MPSFVKVEAIKKAYDVVYKKRDVTVVFSIQKSQFSSEVWYYYFGICINALASNDAKSISACHVTYQIHHMIDGVMLDSSMLCRLIERWETMYGTLYLLRKSAIKGRLSGIIDGAALTYLTSGDISKLSGHPDM